MNELLTMPAFQDIIKNSIKKNKNVLAGLVKNSME